MSKKQRDAKPPPPPAPSAAANNTTTAPAWVLPALVGVYCLLTLLLIFRVPFGQSPDEGGHFGYVAHIAENGTPPVFKKVQAPEYGYEFHQPPLYYAVCAPLWKLSGDPAQKYLCRIVSMICGALTLVLLWSAALALFPGQSLLAILATGFAALLPMHQAVGAAGSNDAVAGLWCAAMLWAIARAAGRPWEWRDSVLVGVFFGLGMLAKSSSLTIGLASVGAAWTLSARRGASGTTSNGNRPSPFMAAATILGVTFVLSGWWLARNQMLYGDPLAAGAFQEAFVGSSPSPQMFLAMGVTLATYLQAFFLILFCTFWGIFGGPNTADKMLNPFRGSGPDPAAMPAIPFMLICAAATVIVVLGPAHG